MLLTELFIHSFDKYLLSMYYGPGTMLGARDPAVKKADKKKKMPVLLVLTVWWSSQTISEK